MTGPPGRVPMPVRAVDDKPSDTLVVVSGEGFWTGSSTLPHLHQLTLRRRGARRLVLLAIMADVEEVEVVVAHRERATLRVGDVFLKIDADQTRTDVEVEAMAMAPVPTPGDPVAEAARARPRRPPGDGTRPPRGAVHRVAGGVGRGGCRRTEAARRAAAAMARPEPRRVGIAPRRRVRVARRQRRPSHRRGHAQPPARRGCAPAVDTGVHPRRPADHPRLRRR